MVNKKSPKRIRRTNEQLCIDLKKDRNKLYKKRSAALKDLKKSRLPKRRKTVLENQVARASKNITKINVRLVKCSKKWENFKVNKRKIRRKINTLKRQIRDGELSSKEINRLQHEIRGYSEIIEKLEGKLYEPYMEEAILPKGQKDRIVREDGNIIEEYLVLWEVKEKVEDAISIGRFDRINIDGIFLKTDDLGAVIMELDIFLTDIADKQHLTATPMVILILDFPQKLISVINNTSDI